MSGKELCDKWLNVIIRTRGQVGVCAALAADIDAELASLRADLAAVKQERDRLATELQWPDKFFVDLAALGQEENRAWKKATGCDTPAEAKERIDEWAELLNKHKCG